MSPNKNLVSENNGEHVDSDRSNTTDRSEGRLDRGVSVWGEEELAVLAMLVTGGAFPTVDPTLITALEPEVGDAVIAAAIRSLADRSLLETSDGVLRLTGLAAELTEVALAPEVIVTAEWLGGGNYDAAWFGINGTTMCRIDAEPNGGRRIQLASSDALIDSICDFAGLTAPAGANSASATATAQVDLEAIVDPSSPVRLVQAQSAWIDGGERQGAVASFLVLDGHGRIARENPPEQPEVPANPSGDMGLSGPDAATPRSWTLHESGTGAVRDELGILVPGQTAGPAPV